MFFRQRVVRNRVVRACLRPFLLPVPRLDMERLGSSYGGWWVPTALLDATSIVYSVGIGGDTTFDEALIDRFGCEVWGFDPTPFSIEYVSSREFSPAFHFEPVGLWTEATTLSFQPMAGKTSGSASITRAGNVGAAFDGRVEPLDELMKRNGHETIDLLKLDIEGAEGPVLDALLASRLRPEILCVEYDQPEAPWSLVSRVRRLLRGGYELNHVEGWNYTFTQAASGLL